jgi:nucleotide-binding universal stress UspA family protein
MYSLKMPSAVPATGVRASAASPIIIATDGREQSDGALAMGRLLAGSTDAIRLVTVLRALPMVPDMPLAPPIEAEEERRTEATKGVAAQANRVWNEAFEVELHDGDPATAIARLAHEAGATMIVAGIGRHRVTDRVFGDETALRLVRLADVPVLAAAAGAKRAPRCIVVAMDFSETSLRAARLAVEMAAPDATVYLAHVAPRDTSFYDAKRSGTTYKIGAGDALERTRLQLHIPEGVAVRTTVLQGDAATELLAFATSIDADVIATGSHGHGFVARMLIGSVATRLVRCGTCSVLTVPYAAVMTQAGVSIQRPIVRTVPQSDWSAQLDEFSRRNVGRPARLEIDDPEIGARAQGFDYPFRGAVHDTRDSCVALMLGESAWRVPRLTRAIAGATAVEIMQDERGHDLALRIAHREGQTLLTFAS